MRTEGRLQIGLGTRQLKRMANMCRCDAERLSGKHHDKTNTDVVHKDLPANTIANKDSPTAKGPMTPKEGSPMATAYTVDTSTKVITVSQPNNIPAIATAVQLLVVS